MVVGSKPGFRRHNLSVLREAQAALNVAFGAILSAYIGNSLAEIDNRPFDTHLLARFFILLAIFILGLSVGNSVILRGQFLLGTLFLAGGMTAAAFAHAAGRALGFEVVVLRLIALCWVFALIGGDAVLTLINYVHHRNLK